MMIYKGWIENAGDPLVGRRSTIIVFIIGGQVNLLKYFTILYNSKFY